MPLNDHIDTEEIFHPIDWNTIQDDVDLEVWNRLNTNLWLPEKIAVSNDLGTWKNLTDTEKLVTMRVFAGLTLLDTIQGTVGAISLLPDAVTPHEEAVLTQIAYMESVHARSYSSIFSTLSNTEDINEAFRWARENPELQKKARMIVGRYRDADPLMRKAASTILESFLFYSGFYIAFKWASMAKLTNTADIIRLILRDEAIHGYYIGYKFQRAFALQPEEIQKEVKGAVYDLLYELYENEVAYTEDLYDPLGWTEDVKAYLRYNANKALVNLGFDPLFPEDTTRMSDAIRSAIDPGAMETQDFFSGSGSGYFMPKTEATEDDDWDF